MAISFKGAHFPKDIILMGVRWYVAYPLSYRHVEEALIGFQGRGLEDVVHPDFCHDLFLKAFIFQWP